MKKFILSLGLIAMAFNLTNCAQYEEATPSVETKGDFALYASVSRGFKAGGFNTQMFSEVLQRQLKKKMGLSQVIDVTAVETA